MMDISREPKHVLEAYGAEPAKPPANNCLLARRAGRAWVSFIQLCHRGLGSHGNLPADIRKTTPRTTDQGQRRVVLDIKARG